MRTIKFRAWDKYRGEKGIMLENHTLKTISICKLGENEDLIWMQFTGLKDINGIDIYEGDIVEGISNNPFDMGDISNYEIMWGIDSWHVKGTYFSLQELFNYCNNEIKIIGNIYE